MSTLGPTDRVHVGEHVGGCNERCSPDGHFLEGDVLVGAIDVLEPMERQALTIWCDGFSAQVRDYKNLDGSDCDRLVFYVRPDAMVSKEEGHPYEFGWDDVERLRQLLNEAHQRRVARVT